MLLGAPGSGCSVNNPDNSLIGSISLFDGLFQRPRAVRQVRWIASLLVQAVTVEARSSSELSGTALAASVPCWTTGILHFVAELNSEMS